MSHFPTSKELGLPGEKIEHYAASFYIRHHLHGLGYLILGLAVAFLIAGAFAVLHILFFSDARAFHPLHYLATVSCFVLAGLCWAGYRHFAQSARDFAFICTDGGNETYADVRDFYRSYTGEEP